MSEIDNIYNLVVSNQSDSSVTIGDWWNPWPTTTTNTYITYPTTVYMYQLRCPKCRKMNWGQLDIITICKNCKSSLKAVSKKVDYEIAVNE